MDTQAKESLTTRHSEILQAAVKVFDACGYAAATMEAVAAEAQISKGSIYNYFQNKQDLFVHVFQHSLASGGVEPPQDAGATASEKLEHVLDHWFSKLPHCRKLAGLLLEFWAVAARQERQEVMARFFDDAYHEGRANIRRIIAEGKQGGEFGDHVDPDIAAALVMAVIDGCTVQTILDVLKTVDQEYIEAMKRAVLVSLKTPKELAAGKSE